MNDYQIDFRLDRDRAIPVLYITITGELPDSGYSLPAVINCAHALIDHGTECQAVYLVYDFTRTSGKLPLAALMRRDPPSPKVKRAAIVGARSRADEMAILIMAAACHIPYEYEFFDSLADAAAFLQATESASLGC